MNERHLDPPDPAPACEHCGGEVVNANAHISHMRGAEVAWECINSFCPSKFEVGSIPWQMACELNDLHDMVARLRKKAK